MPQSVTQHRITTGNHVNWSDKQQGNQKRQNERIQQLAAQPGYHTGNRDRQQLAGATLQFISVVTSLRNTDIRPAITSGRADELAIQERIIYADNLYRGRMAEQAFNREVMRNAGQSARTDIPVKTQESASEPREASSQSSEYPAAQPIPEKIKTTGSLPLTAPSVPIPEKAITPSLSGDTARTATGGENSFSAMLSSVANAVHEVGQRISRHDPLRFPGADASALPAPAASSSDNAALQNVPLKRHRSSPSYGRKKSHTRLVRMLQKEGFLAKSGKPGSFTKTDMAAAVGHLLFGQDHRIPYSVSEQDKRLIRTAGYILRAEGLYGGKVGENVTPEQAGAVIRNWLFKNLLGMSAERYLADKVTYLRHHNRVTAGMLGSVLRAAVQDRGKDLQSFSEGQKMLFRKLCDYAVDDTLPFSNRPETDPVLSLSITDDEFVWTHTGALLLTDAGADPRNISTEECRVAGRALWEMAESGDISVSNLKYLRLPALLFQAERHPEKIRQGKNDNLEYVLNTVSDYAEYRRTTGAVYNDFRTKLDDFRNTTEAWTSRGNIAERYVSKCPRETLISMGRELPPVNTVPGMYPGLLSVDEKIKDGKHVAREAYLNGRTPEGCPPADVSAEYTLKTEQMANAFAKVDNYFVAMAMGSLDKSELDFINNENAVARQVSSSLTRYGLNFSEIKKELQNTDLFSVSTDVEERIYAFIGQKDGGYKLERLDRDTAKYVQHDLFGFRQKNTMEVTADGRVLKPAYFPDMPKSSWDQRFLASGQAITGKGTPADNLVQYFNEKHHKEFYSQMYAAGYDPSNREQLWNFFKHFIPFYDCITDKFPDNLPSCIFDAMSFIPVAGEAASLGGKFGMSLARGVRAGMGGLAKGIYAPRVIGTQVMKEISLPTLRELSSLSKSAIRTLDPGFEMLGGIGKYSYKGVTNLAKWVRKGKNAADIGVMKSLLKKIPAGSEIKKGHHSLSSGLYKTANLQDSEIKVPVTMVGKSKGQDIYVMVDPDTGGRFGKRYIIDHEGRLKLHTNIKNRVKVKQNKKDFEINNNPCSKGRTKRGLDEICKPPRNNLSKYPDDNRIGKMSSEETATGKREEFELVRHTALERLNPVRHDILRIAFKNLIKVSDAATTRLSKMSNAELVRFVKENIRLVISEASADVLRKHIMETNLAARVLFNEMDTRVLINLNSGSKEHMASYIYENGYMLVREEAFDAPDVYMIETLLHESSHAIGTRDYIYIAPSMKHPFDVKQFEEYSHIDINKGMNKYFNEVKAGIQKEGFKFVITPGIKDIYPEAGADKLKELSNAGYVVNSDAKLSAPIERGIVNSADTVAYLTIMLSGVTDKYWFKKNNLVLEDTGILRTNPESRRNLRVDEQRLNVIPG